MAIFSVTNTNDIGIGSLRQAIREANALAGKDTINFDGVFADSFADTITLGGSSLRITDDLSIEGTNADLLTVNANNASRVFEINSGITVKIEGLTITNGYSTDSGGGIYNQGFLTVNNSTITNNTSEGYGGGIFNANTSDDIFDEIISQESLTVSNSTISGNSAGGGGGIYGGTVINSTVSDNLAWDGTGGGIYNGTVINSTVSGNIAGYGGGVYNGKVIDSIVSGNYAYYGGGVFDGKVIGSVINGNYASVSGGGILKADERTVITNSTISDNSAGERGGGIYGQGGVVVSNSTISGNSASFGGGVYNPESIISCTISGNFAEEGGGIYVFSSDLTVNNSTISGNSGDGIYVPALIYRANLQMSNSTVVGNTYGIINSNNAIINNSIIAGNTNFDIRGNFISNGSNLIGELGSSRGFNLNEQLNVPLEDVLDTTLRDNGGPVKTHALVTGSPAINAGNNADVPVDTTDLDADGNTTEKIPFDQRGLGFARISGGQVDVGAYEAAVNVINGTDKRDKIIGTNANDIITGLQRGDTLTGGAGADTFVYTSLSDARDIITDFELGTDKIVLQRQLFNSSGLPLNFTNAVSGGYLRFETQGSKTIVLIDPDGSSGNGRAVSFLTVNNTSATALNNANNFAFIGLPAPASNTYIVTNTNDSGSGSLRQAIQDANTSFGKDTIKFDGVFADNIPDTISLVNGKLVIKDDLIIDGTGADLLTVSGNNKTQTLFFRLTYIQL